MKLTLIILVSAFLTATISGIFGMAGGMIFMGIIASLFSVSQAMVIHGAVQSISNSYRAYLLKPDIRWDILGYELLGAIPAILILAGVAFVPQKGVLFIALGALPLLLWLPKGWFQGDAQKPLHAVLCGALVIGLNLSAGVAGPALDFFYVKTSLSRQEVVATKAVTMFGAHMVKIVYFGLPILTASALSGLPPGWVFIAVIPCVMAGTFLGTRILNQLSDVGFRQYTKYIVSLIGLVYLWRGASLLGWI